MSYIGAENPKGLRWKIGDRQFGQSNRAVTAMSRITRPYIKPVLKQWNSIAFNKIINISFPSQSLSYNIIQQPRDVVFSDNLINIVRLFILAQGWI